MFGSLDMSQNQILNYLRAIESQPRVAECDTGYSGFKGELHFLHHVVCA